MLQHAGNKQSEMRLASITPSTLHPACQLHAMTYSCAPRPASRGGRAIAFIITGLHKAFGITGHAHSADSRYRMDFAQIAARCCQAPNELL